jgi:hypothetical protein
MKLSWAVQVIEDSAAVGMKVFYKQGPDEHGATFTKAPEVLRRSWLDVPFCQQQRGEMK